MRSFHILSVLLLFTIFSCAEKKENSEIEKIKFHNKAHELVYNTVQKVGNMETLKQKKDVYYVYTYETADGKKDIAREEYYFEGELSKGIYLTHQRTLAHLSGPIIQGQSDNSFWLKHDNKYIEDQKDLDRVRFNRKTNYYWFCMFQKLLDPGLHYEYIKTDTVDQQSYDVINISFDSKNNKPTDIYQLFINQKTKLIDQFLFTVADFDVMEKPLLMKVQYEKFDGMLIPTKRKYKQSTWDAEIDDGPWTKVTWTDIRFNNGFRPERFSRN